MHLSIANLNSFSIRLFIIVGVAVLGINNAFAQQYYNDNRYNQSQRNANVIIYSDCNFRGAAQELRVGDYPNLKTMRLNNDSISSIKIPQGFEVTFYQHHRFGGESATASEDIACLNPQWNDQISSLRITADYRDQNDNRANRDNRDRRGGERGQGNRGNEDRPFDARNQNNRNNQGNHGNHDDNRARVNGNNLISVSYAASTLDYLQNGVWRQTNRRGRTIDFAETSRDKNSVYLQGQNTGERIRVDLFSNDVTIVAQNGEQRKFPILDMRSGNVVAARPTPVVPVAPTPNQVVPSGCFNYKAYTLGGEGGIRFHGHDGFHRFHTKGHSDRICHNGALTMEINKTSPATVVIVEINGQTHRFDKNEEPDTFLNTWYRKKVTLKVGGR